MPNKFWLALAAACIVCVIIYAFLSSKAEYFYSLAIDPAYPKEEVFARDINSPTDEFPGIDMDGKIAWLKSASEIIEMNASDGALLKAYSVKSPEKSHKWAIVIHGYTQAPLQMSPPAYEFFARGFNVLLPNLRAHGLSDGNYIGMGWADRKDVLAWADKIIAGDPESEIVLYGISMGAATVMMVSGEKLPSNIKCFVEDCGYTSAWDEFAYQLKSLYGLPAFPMMNMVDRLIKKRAGYGLKEASALEQVKKCGAPMMFIHGTKDRFVPFYMQDTLYNAAACEKTKMTVENAGHGESYKIAPEIYWKNVFDFINEYIPN